MNWGTITLTGTSRPCSSGMLKSWNRQVDCSESEMTAMSVKQTGLLQNSLVPANPFVSRISSEQASIEVIRGLAREFATSLSMTAIRYAELTDRAVAAILSRDGQIEWGRVIHEDSGTWLVVGTAEA